MNTWIEQYSQSFWLLGLAGLLVTFAILWIVIQTLRKSKGMGATRKGSESLDSQDDLALKLDRSRGAWVKGLGGLLQSRSQIDSSLYEELEELMVTSDIGIQTTEKLLNQVREQVSRKSLKDPKALRTQLHDIILSIFAKQNDDDPLPLGEHKPYVLFVVGVNGVGKTTTIGKLATRYAQKGNKVILAAADTFRAAAVEQLKIWADRAEVEVIAHPDGKDPSAVIYDAAQASISRKADLLIVDTAGRLHTKVNLIEELKKMYRTIQKVIPEAPHQTWLVLDATTGQNALQQAKTFHDELGGISKIVCTKLDGTAKGGVLISLAERLEIPIAYIGVGESVEDLRPFHPQSFVDALFQESA